MNIWWDAALWLLVLWLSALVFQVADLGTAWYDVRSARTRTVQFAGRRAHEIFWVVPVAALSALVPAFGVAVGAGMVLDRGWQLAGGVLLSLAVIVLVSVGLVVGLVRLLTRDVQGYAVLRFRVRDAKARKVTKDDIARWRSELEAIDTREAVRHEDVARWLRLIPIAFGLLALAAVWVAIAQDLSVSMWPLFGLLAVLPPVVSGILAARGARLSLRARAAWALVNGRQRELVVQAIEELERRTNRGVAGLSDRVNRALSILREQQL
ncbi:hypothetical protein OH146_13200 [Salinibacterium sp. SYSU T00001]|uniref:hypothetical protein n=1 Tax=Homoserinimonas sedimenticola TaxID=2986805 RepID=UPI0022356D28|nr:hypothetical protein [Salinibacterium sedimenticola]MCW4386732.1 hypothetical protein [Salinibacterium sedimenticola]